MTALNSDANCPVRWTCLLCPRHCLRRTTALRLVVQHSDNRLYGRSHQNARDRRRVFLMPFVPNPQFMGQRIYQPFEGYEVMIAMRRKQFWPLRLVAVFAQPGHEPLKSAFAEKFLLLRHRLPEFLPWLAVHHLLSSRALPAPYWPPAYLQIRSRRSTRSSSLYQDSGIPNPNLSRREEIQGAQLLVSITRAKTRGRSAA